MIALFAIVVFELIALVVLTVLHIEQQDKIEQLKLSNKIGFLNDDDLKAVLKNYNLDKVNLDKLKKAFLKTLVTGGFFVPSVPAVSGEEPLVTSKYPTPVPFETKEI